MDQREEDRPQEPSEEPPMAEPVRPDPTGYETKTKDPAEPETRDR